MAEYLSEMLNDLTENMYLLFGHEVDFFLDVNKRNLINYLSLSNKKELDDEERLELEDNIEKHFSESEIFGYSWDDSPFDESTLHYIGSALLDKPNVINSCWMTMYVEGYLPYEWEPEQFPDGLPDAISDLESLANEYRLVYKFANKNSLPIGTMGRNFVVEIKFEIYPEQKLGDFLRFVKSRMNDLKNDGLVWLDSITRTRGR